MASKVTQSRWVALNTLRALREGELLDHAFHRLVQQVAPRERAFAQELAYGTVRLRGRLDFLLSPFVRRGLDALEPDVLDILRLGAYQLLEMNSVPSYAAISQSVEMTKGIRKHAVSGLVNGVLQAFSRAGSDRSPPRGRDVARYLAGWGSHPKWLIERWLAQFGAPATEALVLANNQKPDLFVRVLGRTRERALEQLQQAGIEAHPVGAVGAAIRIAAADVLRTLELLPAVVQDPAAMMVVEYAGFEAGRVFDLCAAPGGKALAVSDHRQDLLAGDVSFARITRLRENAARTRAPRVTFFVGDARQPPFRQLDQVLIDAPCTGTGTLRRHPDGKWRLQPGDVASLARLQREILDAVAPLVRPGGLLVYATCSLEREENEAQVDRFLAEHRDFILDPEGYLRVLPHEHGFDGAFAARLRRVA